MTRQKIIIAAMIIVSIFFIRTLKASAEKIPIEIDETCHDKYLGRKLIYQIKDNIKKSNSFKLSDGTGNRLQLHIITIEGPLKDVTVIYSIVWLLIQSKIAPIYLNNYVGWCGAKLIKDTAEFILAETDKTISDSLGNTPMGYWDKKRE